MEDDDRATATTTTTTKCSRAFRTQPRHRGCLPEFFYDFCLDEEVTLAGQSHRDLSVRPSISRPSSLPLSLSSSLAQRSRLIFVSPGNDVFAKNYFYATRPPFFASLFFLCAAAPLFTATRMHQIRPVPRITYREWHARKSCSAFRKTSLNPAE